MNSTEKGHICKPLLWTKWYSFFFIIAFIVSISWDILLPPWESWASLWKGVGDDFQKGMHGTCDKDITTLPWWWLGERHLWTRSSGTGKGLQEKKNRGERFSTSGDFWEKVREEDRISKGRLLLSWENLWNQVLEAKQSLFELELFRCSYCMICYPIFAPFCSISCWCLGLFPMIESGH